MVNVSIDEINTDSHRVVNVNRVHLIKLNRRKLILTRLSESVQSILEEFGAHGDVRLLKSERVPWLKAIRFCLLELFVAFWRAGLLGLGTVWVADTLGAVGGRVVLDLLGRTFIFNLGGVNCNNMGFFVWLSGLNSCGGRSATACSQLLRMLLCSETGIHWRLF